MDSKYSISEDFSKAYVRHNCNIDVIMYSIRDLERQQKLTRRRSIPQELRNQFSPSFSLQRQHQRVNGRKGPFKRA